MLLPGSRLPPRHYYQLTIAAALLAASIYRRFAAVLFSPRFIRFDYRPAAMPAIPSATAAPLLLRGCLLQRHVTRSSACP